MAVDYIKTGAENKKKASKGGNSMDDKTAPSTPTHQTVIKQNS